MDFVSRDDDIPNIWKVIKKMIKMFQTTNQMGIARTEAKGVDFFLGDVRWDLEHLGHGALHGPFWSPQISHQFGNSSQMPGKSRNQPVEIQILGMFNGCWHHDRWHHRPDLANVWRFFGCTPCLSGSKRTFLLLSSFFSISCAGNRSMGKTWTWTVPLNMISILCSWSTDDELQSWDLTSRVCKA